MEDLDLPLIRSLQGGDAAALDELINRHREPLHRFVYRYLRDEAATADVVQETFVRVYFKAGNYEPRSTVRTWIYAIALNLCRDQFRRAARRGSTVSFEEVGGGRASGMEPVDPDPGPGAQAVKSDQFVILQRAIDQLPHALKAALVLFSLEGHSQKETAEILGTTPKTVELRVYHAKEKLRQLLGNRLGDEA